MMNSFRRIIGGLAVVAAIATSVPAFAQSDEPFFLTAIIKYTEGGAKKSIQAYIDREKDGEVIYFLSANSAGGKKVKVSDIDAIGYVDHEDLVAARDAFELRKFKIAAKLFEPLMKRYERYAGMPESPYKEVAYKYVFSLQESGQYAKAQEEWTALDKSQLSPYQRGMLSTVPAWVAYKGKEWKRLAVVCNGLKDTEEMLPLGAHVRISFLLGSALAKLGEDKKALVEFHRTMTLDAGESEELIAKAAVASLKLYDNNEQVKEYFLLLGRPEFDAGAGYTIPVRSAGWIAKMMDSQKPAGKELPADYQRYLEAYNEYSSTPAE